MIPKQNEDIWLENLLEEVPLKDEGFSGGVVRKLRLKLWLRRALFAGTMASCAVVVLLICRSMGLTLSIAPRDWPIYSWVAIVFFIGIFGSELLDSETQKPMF